MKRIAILALSAVCLGALTSSAAEAANPFTASLSHVSAAELPPTAADLIKNAKSRERVQTTINVVKAAVGINPAAAPAIVGSIARSQPDMAGVAAGTASAEQPKQASAIAKAAATAAPTKVGKIVVAVCRAVPNEYMNIATAVAQAVPNAAREILDAVAAALPQLKPSIDRVLAGYTGTPSVPGVLGDASKLAASQPTAVLASTPVGTPSASGAPAGGAPSARGPAVGPPYVPLSGTPGNVNPGTSGDVPTGGRNYAAP